MVETWRMRDAEKVGRLKAGLAELRPADWRESRDRGARVKDARWFEDHADGATPDRPPILTTDLAKAADEMRRLRHVAVRGYDNFDLHRAKAAVEAAKLLTLDLEACIRTFQAQLDPPGSSGGK